MKQIINNITFKREAVKSYAILKVDNNQLQNHQIQMLKNNKIEMLLDVDVRTDNLDINLYYDITSKLKLEQVVERKKLLKDEVITLFKGIATAIIASKKYFLTENNFILDKQYIYVDTTTMEPSLMYLPVSDINENILDQTQKLIDYLMTKINNQEADCVVLMHKLFNLSRSETFNYKKMIQILNDASQEWVEELDTNIKVVSDITIDKKIKKQYKPQTVQYNNNKLLIGLIQGLVIILLILSCLTGVCSSTKTGAFDITKLIGVIMIIGVVDYFICKNIIDKNKKNKKASNIEKKNKKINMNIKEKKVKNKVPKTIEPKSDYNESYVGETRILSQEMLEKKPYLIKIKENNIIKIQVENNPFRIGKLEGQVDCVIENTTVSRVHAELVEIDNKYYMIDLNSKNGTYINDKKIENNTKNLINEGDKIMFSNDEYIFKIL